MNLNSVNTRRSTHVVDTIVHQEGQSDIVVTESGAMFSNVPREMDDVTLSAFASAVNEVVTARMAFRETGRWF